MRALVLAAVTVALGASAGCDGRGNAGPDTIPVDPGTVVVLVIDDARTPMGKVWVYVHDIPNHVGTTYSRGRATNASGVADIIGVPAGPRRVEVRPPAGYGVAEPIVPVTVVKDAHVQVTFVLAQIAE
jgi:hypothetical protein